MIRKVDAIYSLHPEVATWSFNALEGIKEWDSDDPKPTAAEIDAEVIRLQVIEDDQLYARNRKADYPSQGDQNDMIYKDMLNSTTTHKDAVEAVKTKWPKNNKGPIE